MRPRRPPTSTVAVPPIAAAQPRAPPASAAATAAATAGCLFAEALAQRTGSSPSARDVDQVAGRLAEGRHVCDVELVGDLRPQLRRERRPSRGAPTRARPSGWRVRTFASARAARPSSTSRRTSATCSASSSSISALVGRRPGRQVDRLRRVRASPARTTSCQTRSVTNGTIGASSRVSTSRHSCSVASAAGSPSQKRRRDRRTYQFDRSSTKSASRGPARCVSKPSSAASTSRTSRLQLGQQPPVEHRPVRRLGVRLASGVQPLVRRVERLERRRVPVGQQHLADDLLQRRVPDPARQPRRAAGAAMNQRSASAPCSSISGIGSRMLPRCLDILRPSSARMQPEAQHVLVRRPVEHQRPDRHQRVEPAAGLVDGLADELRRVGRLELFGAARSRTGSPTGRTASSRSRTRRR